MNIPNADVIRKLVFDAFDGPDAHQLPREVVAEVISQDTEDTNRFFRGKDWHDLCTIDELHGSQDSLTFFTLEAFVYYLPAFILASLEDWDEADLIPEWLFNRLERDEIVWKWLTEEQRKVVEAFREWDEFMCGGTYE